MAKRKPPATAAPKPPNMDKLFDRIKLELTKDDRLEMVEKFRAERELWNQKQDKKDNEK